MRVISLVYLIFLFHGVWAQSDTVMGVVKDTTGRPAVRLKEVTVTGKKAMVEQKTDRMVINVRNSITSAGGTALDVLEKAPGVTVSRQSNTIGINGKNGVTVMINGKISYMPPDALIQFLAGISAGNIDKIELITTPPAKYDANGNAGYINIVLINNPYSGADGSYFLTGGYTHRELIGGAGGNFNYRSGGINLYGSYSFNHDHWVQPSTGFVQFGKGGDVITNTSFSDRNAITDIQNARIGIDYQLDTATVIGALVSGYISRWSMIAHNGVTIRKNNVTDSTIASVDDPELNLWQNVVANLNFQHTFQPGQVLFFDMNYLYYRDNNPNSYSTDYYNKQNAFLEHADSRSGKITPIHFRVVSSDYTMALGKKVKMETGAKISLSTFTNDVSADNWKQGGWVPDANLSANYLLKENIGAAYTSFVASFSSKLSVTAGLRYEYTSSDLGSATTPHLINRKYGELFPTLNASQKIDDDNSVNFSYSRRITRPTFNDLAPFTVFFDPKTYYSGNPALQPAIANTVQASYGFKKYNFSISYTYEANTIDNWYFQTQRLDTASKTLYLSARNFKYERYLTTTFSLPFRITDRWSMQNNINGSWRVIHTSYADQPIVLRNFDYSINSTQQFLLPAGFALELTGSYSSPAYVGTEKRKSVYQVDAGLQKKLGVKGDVLRFAANDIFNSGSYWRFGETLPGSGAIVNRTFNYGAVAYRLTYTHHFGNNALKAKRERTTGAEEELRRVHN